MVEIVGRMLVCETTTMLRETAELVPPVLDAVRENVEVPVVVGVPEISPLAAFKVSPAGRVPEISCQEVAAGLACNVCRYATLWVPPGKLVVEILGAAEFTTKVKDLATLVPPAFEAVTENVLVTTFVGVPLIMPDVDPRLSPAGRVPELTVHVVGVLVAAKA